VITQFTLQSSFYFAFRYTSKNMEHLMCNYFMKPIVITRRYGYKATCTV